MTENSTILIIDDSRPAIIHLEKILKPLGRIILKAENGAEGIKLYKANPDRIDLVITDIVMPKKEGMETIKDLLAMNPRLKVIAMTSANLDYLIWAETLGAVTTLIKPFPANTLETVKSTLES